MAEQSRRVWFKTKKYGWGWTPCTPEGWGVVAAGIALFTIFLTLAIAFGETPALFVVFFLLALTAIGAMVYVSWRTGEKPRWRWGGS